MMNRFGKSVVAKLLPNENKKAAKEAAAAVAELELVEKRDPLKLTKTFRYGFPYEPTSIAFDMIQHILAIGTRNGTVKLYGGEFIETSISHPTTSAVLFMSFVINEGALITYCEDTTISFWNLRQKQPAISHSKKLINERASTLFLPLKNKWLYLGTEKGNIYLLNIYSAFSQSGYDIKWNNVIELSQKTHPGKVIHLSEHPTDNTRLLIGFETGLIVLWNIKNKKADARFNGPPDTTLLSICWFYDAKQFMSSHSNGCLITWNCKIEGKPVSSFCPHYDETDLVRSYNTIPKVIWETKQNGESLIIFSNGLSQKSQMIDAITIIRNKMKTVLEMKSKIIDFTVIESALWQTDDPPDAFAMIVLLEDNLVTIDLKTEGYPIFEHHHSIELHESPITFYDYLVDPDLKLIQHIFVSKERETKTSTSNELPKYSTAPYPVSGGIKSLKTTLFPYYELVVTGHQDGTVKLWEASGICLDHIYKIKTHKIFDKRRVESNSIDVEYPFKISNVTIHSNYMAVAGVGGHVTLYKYISKKCNPADEELANIAQLDIPVVYDYSCDRSHPEIASSPNSNIDHHNKKDLKSLLRVKIGYKRSQGFQPELVCLLLWSQKPPTVNTLVINPKYSILFIGTDESIICVDYVSRTTILNISLIDYYGSQDPYNRVPKSPKRTKATSDSFFSADENSSDNNPLNFLAKQFTLDNSHYNNLQRTMDATLRDGSKSPSCSSLDNLSQNEGVSCIAFNEPINPILNASKIEQPSNTVVWLGTTYGTVILLTINCVLNEFLKEKETINSSTLSSSLGNNSSGGGNGGIAGVSSSLQSNAGVTSNTNTKIITLIPNGVKHFLKGQVLSITFLDNFGNVITQKLQQHPNTIAVLHNPSSSSSLNSTGNNSINNNSNNNTTSSNNNNNNTNSNSNSSSNMNSTSDNSSSNTTNVNNNNNNVSTSYASDDMKVPTKSQKKPLMMSRSARVESVSEYSDRIQYAVLCSERQLKVISLPSQNCTFKYDLDDETPNIAKASVTIINNYSYLICLLTNGNFLTFNLPSLKPSTNLTLSLNQREKEEFDQILKTFTFGAKGHSYYMSTPSELQKLIISTVNENHNITEMLPELFDPKIATPIAPKPGILKSIFSTTPLDREQLFGETSGKPSISIVRNNPLDAECNKATKELTELQKLALQRGEKLGALEKRTEEMTMQASAYAENASKLANKYKKKSQWPFS